MEARDTPWRRSYVAEVVQMCRDAECVDEMLQLLLEDLDDVGLTLTWLAAKARQKSHWDAAYTRATVLLDDQLTDPPE